jgi:Ca2+:H+ antiporter
VISLIFTLRTHRDLYATDAAHDDGPPVADVRPWVAILLIATVVVAIISEFLVGAVTASAEALGLTQLFVGVVVVAIIGNAAEHSTAVLMALKNKMDVAINIAVGSSIQVALFVAPVLVLLSYLVAPRPMDLIFTRFEVMAVAVSVLIMGYVAADGESHWMEGVQLLAVYAILGIAFFFLPVGS